MCLKVLKSNRKETINSRNANWVAQITKCYKPATSVYT